MINTAEVMLWGTRIGIIHMNEANGVVAFEYDKDFLKSNIEVSPIHMPLSERVYEFPELARTAFHGAPGLVADSLPDKCYRQTVLYRKKRYGCIRIYTSNKSV